MKIQFVTWRSMGLSVGIDILDWELTGRKEYILMVALPFCSFYVYWERIYDEAKYAPYRGSSNKLDSVGLPR